MINPLEIVRLGIRYFIRMVGWMKVAEIVREEYPNEEKRSRLDE